MLCLRIIRFSYLLICLIVNLSAHCHCRSRELIFVKNRQESQLLGSICSRIEVYLSGSRRIAREGYRMECDLEIVVVKRSLLLEVPFQGVVISSSAWVCVSCEGS